MSLAISCTHARSWNTCCPRDSHFSRRTESDGLKFSDKTLDLPASDQHLPCGAYYLAPQLSCLRCIAKADFGHPRASFKPPPEPAQIPVVVGLVLGPFIGLHRVGGDAEVIHGSLDPHFPLPELSTKNYRVRAQSCPVLNSVRAR